MKLVYKGTDTEVQVGDVIQFRDGAEATVTHFREPHKPSSEGKICVKATGDQWSHEFYVGVIGAEWIEREDRVGW